MLLTLKILIKTAKELNIPYRLLDPANNLVEFGRGKRTTIVFKTITHLNSAVACEISSHKSLTSKILQKNGLPVQYQVLCKNFQKAKETSQKIGFPLVIKPNVGSQGRGVTANITSKEELERAIKKAFSGSRNIVISNFYPGEDYRILVLKGKPLTAIKRLPPTVIGDGKNSLKRLIEKENQKREKYNLRFKVGVYKNIKIDQETLRQLRKNNLTINSLLPKGKALILSSVANCSTGGLAQTLELQSFHPTIIKGAVKAAELIGLVYAAIDFILKDPKKPFAENNGVILETNSSPGLVPHHYPFFGRPQKIAPLILKTLLS